jgi:hypothetical protein
LARPNPKNVSDHAVAIEWRGGGSTKLLDIT